MKATLLPQAVQLGAAGAEGVEFWKGYPLLQEKFCRMKPESNKFTAV